MIEIVAKDYSHFYNILREYNIAEEKAIFVTQKIVQMPVPYIKDVPERSVKMEGADWCDYRSFA